MRENRFSILMLAFALLVSVEVALYNLDRAGVPAGQSDFASQAYFDIHQLRELITKNKLNTVEQTLEKLPPELLRNYTLQHTSLSLQEASSQNPRAVLFTPNGSLILTFNGNSGQKGFDQIEAASFDSAKNEISFYEIDFDRKGRHAPRFSQANPAKCMNCHGGEGRIPRYVWTAYNSWDGSYGQIDDQIKASPDDAGKRPVFGHYLENEYEEFQKFKTSAPTHPRYKYLYRSAKEPLWPYHKGLEAERKIALMPNFRVESLMSTNYVKAIAQDILSRPRFAQVRMSYLMLNLCSDFGSVDSAKAYERLRQYSRLEFPRWSQGPEYQVDAANLLMGDRVRFLDFRLNPNNRNARKSHYETGGTSFKLQLTYEISRRLIAADPELAKKLKLDEMYTTGYGPAYAYAPADFPEDLKTYFATEITTRLPTNPVPGMVQHLNCDVFIEGARRELARPLPMATIDAVKEAPLKGPEILQKYGCVGCHSSQAYGIGPDIPFGDEAALGEWIAGRSPMTSGALLPDEVKYRVRWPKLSRTGQETGYDQTLSALHDHMPRGGGYLSEQEEETLVRYLNSFSR